MTYQELAAKAPKFEGYRLLDENEPAQAGDLFLYLVIFDMLPTAWQVEFTAEHLAPVVGDGTICIGRSWHESKKEFEGDPASDNMPFDGAIYRKTS